MANLSSFGSSIKSIQKGTIVIANASASNTATITAVTTGKSFVLHGGAYSSNSAAAINDNMAALDLTNSTTVTATRLGTNYNLTISYTVVEFY